jgi:hypothetical protein
MKSINIADLQSGAKRLNNVDNIDSKQDSKPIMDETERNAIESLESIYNKYNGNIDMIFEELKEDPTKAKRFIKIIILLLLLLLKY